MELFAVSENQPSRLLTEKEAAEILNVSIKTMQFWRLVGNGPPFTKLGRLVRYELKELQNFIQQNRRKNTCNVY